MEDIGEFIYTLWYDKYPGKCQHFITKEALVNFIRDYYGNETAEEVQKWNDIFEGRHFAEYYSDEVKWFKIASMSTSSEKYR